MTESKKRKSTDGPNMNESKKRKSTYPSVFRLHALPQELLILVLSMLVGNIPDPAPSDTPSDKTARADNDWQHMMKIYEFKRRFLTVSKFMNNAGKMALKRSNVSHIFRFIKLSLPGNMTYRKNHLALSLSNLRQVFGSGIPSSMCHFTTSQLACLCYRDSELYKRMIVSMDKIKQALGSSSTATVSKSRVSFIAEYWASCVGSPSTVDEFIRKTLETK